MKPTYSLNRNRNATLRLYLTTFLLTLPGSLCFQDVCLALQFTDVTASAGVSYTQYYVTNPPAGFEQYYMSGGAAAGDYDQDGWVDLYVTRLDDSDILFRNKGDGTFEDVTVAAGLYDPNRLSNGAAWGDIDNDGDLDLFVTALYTDSRFYLYINNGSGTFTEEGIARAAAFDDSAWHFGYSISFGDYDRDGWLDILTSEWGGIIGSSGASHSRLLHNLGQVNPGHFEDATDSAGVAMEIGPGVQIHTFAPRFSDLDGDMWPDLAIAADFGESRLFWNQGQGTFIDGTPAAQVGTDENGMGSAIADYDGDGRLDWFVTSVFDPNQTCETEGCMWGYTGNRLYRNEGNRLFSDQTDTAGVRDGKWGWAAAFFDYDNDRDQDLIMTNGVDFPMLTFIDQYRTDPMRLWENNGTGIFTEVAVSLGITDTGSGKSLLTFDYDKDGDLDVFVVNNASTPVLYRNDGGNSNNWLRIKAVGTVSNRDGIGAFITMIPDATQPNDFTVHEVNAGSHFLGQSELTAHFGLGSFAGGTIDKVTIKWPSGLVQVLLDLAVNTVHTISEPNAVCAEWIYPQPFPEGDFNKDCRVNMDDFSLFIQSWMACTLNCN